MLIRNGSPIKLNDHQQRTSDRTGRKTRNMKEGRKAGEVIFHDKRKRGAASFAALFFIS
jgi:hypothetical protein